MNYGVDWNIEVPKFALNVIDGVRTHHENLPPQGDRPWKVSVTYGRSYRQCIATCDH